MTIKDPWSQFQEIVENPFGSALRWKEKPDRRVVGHLLPDVPEEIIYAAGALPVALGGAGVQVSRAQSHIPSYTCSHAMGAMELGLRGDLELLDAMVIPYICDTTRNLYHVWARCFPRMSNEFLRLPKRLNFPEAKEYLRAEFSRLFDALSRLTGLKPDLGKLRDANALYDKSRQRLRDVYRMHIRRPSIWNQERMRLVFTSAFVAPRDEHLTLMEALPWSEEQEDSIKRIPVYVRGKVWDPPGILNVMDELGLLVVKDEIVTGWRSVSEDSGAYEDPLQALVERHVSLIPYTGYHMDPSGMVEGFLQRVKDSGAKGLIFLNPKFCEAAGFDTPDFQKALERDQIPSLVLETSSRGVSLGQIRLRLEAFREVLAGDLP